MIVGGTKVGSHPYYVHSLVVPERAMPHRLWRESFMLGVAM